MSNTVALPSAIDSGQTRTPSKLLVGAKEEITSLAYNPRLPRRRTSPRTVITSNDWSPHHDHYYIRSPAVTEGVEGQTEPTSWNMVPVCSRQSGVVHTRHTIPDLKNVESVPPMILATDPESRLVSSCTFAPPVFDSNSLNAYRRQSSHTGSPHCQRSESEQPPPSRNSHLESPQANQPSLVEKCLVM